ncbi:MAG: hypothetical protein RMM98_16050 [Acidobacteriota bacterium]|nr:hypothetical protein [Blastocatellia bacterium]MDW8241116.1 hypothetical protein [Acidobacteriota bacterium]
MKNQHRFWRMSNEATRRRRRALLVVGLCMAALSALPVTFVGRVFSSTTQVWRQDSRDDFEQGTATNVTIRSDGYIQLAPQMNKLFEATDAHFWSVAEDSKGRIFIGSGRQGKVYVYANGQGRVYFDAVEMEVHALAVDRQDNLYVGTSPDGKVYRISPDGSSQVFYEPGVKYIWALMSDGRGSLYVATGDEGKIFRVDAAGRGSLFFDSDEKHIRCLAMDAQGNILAGSESRARVFRLSPAGKPFVLYDAPAKEITAIVTGPDGSLYVSGIGSSDGTAAAPSGSRTTASAGVVLGVVTITAGDAGSASQESSKEATDKAKPAPPGSAVYRIAPDGHPQEIWRSDKTTIYSLALRSDGQLLAGTGDKGGVYLIRPDGTGSALLNNVEPAQVTALLRSARQPLVYAATSNLAKLYALSSELAREGTLISQVKDTATFSKWGRVFFRHQPVSGAVAKLMTRSGNTAEPDNTWSDWVELTAAGTVASPDARFIQWKLTLTGSPTGQSPVVDSIELAYLPRNVAPKIDALTLQPPDVAFEQVPSYGVTQPFSSAGASGGSSVAAQAQTNRVRRWQQTSGQAPPRQVLKRGYRTITWQASDVNDDDLVYSVYIRGTGETEWKLLKENIEDNFYSWDTTQMPDGDYIVRLVASDARSNTPERALTSERLTEWFQVDNSPPRIEGLTATIEPGQNVRVRFTAQDGATPITDADFLVDHHDPKKLISTDGILDSEQERFEFIISGLQRGERAITVRVSDGAGNMASARTVVKIE